MNEYLSKISQNQIAEVFQDLKDTSPHEASKAEYLLDLGKQLIRVSESARVNGDKVNAFGLAQHGATELKVWMDEKASGVILGEALAGPGAAGKDH